MPTAVSFSILLRWLPNDVASKLHAYCLMTNHFHLLLRSLEGRLAPGIQYLLGRFTRLINIRLGRDGPLFRGRYASVLIQSDAHLVQACRPAWSRGRKIGVGRALLHIAATA